MWYDQQLDYIVSRLSNVFGTAEGSTLPPLQFGDYRVPLVTQLQVTQVIPLDTSTVYILTWNEPEDVPQAQLSHFNVFASQVTLTGLNPSAPVAVRRSPARVELLVTRDSTIVFTVQTVLTNGQVSDPNASPSCTASGTLITALKEITTSDIADGSVTDAKIASVSALKITGQLSAAQIAAGAIDATKINLKTIIVVGLSLTPNTPAAGRITWSACTVYWQGVAYNIPGGNTPSTTNKFVIWNVGTTSFTAVDSFSPSDSVMLIATNTDGTAAESWNRGAGTALNAIQKANISVPFLEGFALQPTASLTLTNPAVTATGGVASFNDFLLLNVTGAAGLLQAFRIYVQDHYVTNLAAAALPGSHIDLYLKVTVDGATPQLLKLHLEYTVSSGVTGPALPFDDEIQCFLTHETGNGTTSGDFMACAALNISFTTSLKLEIRIYCDNPISAAESRTLYGTERFRDGYSLKTS